MSLESECTPLVRPGRQRVPTTCVPTGVKHLHHAAESYDIGVYFEANGHGTVLFSPSALAKIHSAPHAEALQALTELINQTVGDALSDLLLVETVLLHRQQSPGAWDQAYADLPNRLVKVVVADRYAFETTDAERQVTKPTGLQAGVDEIVARFERGRSFVRPSGTEDCVRVYAEAATRELADGEHWRSWIHGLRLGLAWRRSLTSTFVRLFFVSVDEQIWRSEWLVSCLTWPARETSLPSSSSQRRSGWSP